MGQISDKIALHGLFDGAHLYDGVVYTGVYPKDNLERVKSFQFRPDDVLLVGYPKSGRLWLEEAVWLLQNDADFEEAAKKNTRVRVTPVELKVPNQPPTMDKLSKMESPRIMSTYLYYDFFKTELENTKPTVIVMLRNPMDVTVSFYHHYRMCVGFGYYKGSWEDFLKLANSKKLNLGDWFDNVMGWWTNNKDKENVLFVKYEDVVEDARSEIKRLAEFLGHEYSDDVIDKIADHCSFNRMRENPRCNMADMPAYDPTISTFHRKGTPGDWKNYFTEKQIAEFNKKYKKIIGPTGLEMRFELEKKSEENQDNALNGKEEKEDNAINSS